MKVSVLILVKILATNAIHANAVRLVAIMMGQLRREPLMMLVMPTPDFLPRISGTSERTKPKTGKRTVKTVTAVVVVLN